MYYVRFEVLMVRLLPSGMRKHVVWYMGTKLHGVSSQKTVIFILNVILESLIVTFKLDVQFFLLMF
jgi:hypothetical protein